MHQILQWHHMLTSDGYPVDSLRNLQINTLWDGMFHAATWIFVVIGLTLLWRHAGRMVSGLVRSSQRQGAFFPAAISRSERRG